MSFAFAVKTQLKQPIFSEILLKKQIIIFIATKLKSVYSNYIFKQTFFDSNE